MEEKDVTFNFIIGEPDKNGNCSVNITSDIDDCIDYLSIEEKMCLILELITQSGRQIISEKLNDDVEDFDEDDIAQIETVNNLHKFTEETVYLIINSIHNLMKSKFGENPEALEYSLVTYKSTFKEIEDSAFSILNAYTSCAYLDYDQLEKRTKEIEKVKKEDIIKVAKKIHVDTIFLLEGETHEEN